MTSAAVSSLEMSSWTRLGVVSLTSSFLVVFILPRFFCCSRQIEKMLLIELMIWPISFEFLFFRFISFSNVYSSSEFFSDIYTVMIIYSYPLQLQLQGLHPPLLLVQSVLKLGELCGLVLTRKLHLLVDLGLAVHELLVFGLQVFKTVLQGLNVVELLALAALAALVLHDALEEVVELLQLPLFLLLPPQVVLGLLQLLPQVLDLGLLLLDDAMLVL